MLELIARAKLWIVASVILPHAEDDVEPVLSPAAQRLGMACVSEKRSMKAPESLPATAAFAAAKLFTTGGGRRL